MELYKKVKLYAEDDFSNLLSKQGDRFLKYIFDKYYSDLCKLSYKYAGRTDIAEDIVQEVFINIWNKRYTLNATGSIKPYLVKSVINASINYIRSKFVRQHSSETSNIKENSLDYTPHDDAVQQELHLLLKVAIEKLPDKCRTIFSLSRFSNLSHKEIAGELNISLRTVEAQIRIALQKIRQFLLRFGYVLLLFLLK